jgi:hypothetical protein
MSSVQREKGSILEKQVTGFFQWLSSAGQKGCRRERGREGERGRE